MAHAIQPPLAANHIALSDLPALASMHLTRDLLPQLPVGVATGTHTIAAASWHQMSPCAIGTLRLLILVALPELSACASAIELYYRGNVSATHRSLAAVPVTTFPTSLCKDEYCSSIGDDCCAPGTQPRTCTHSFMPVDLPGSCFGHAHARYTCCPADVPATCEDSYCTSVGDDCCAPGDQARTCSHGYTAVDLLGSCFGHAHARYTCCPPGTTPSEMPTWDRTRQPLWTTRQFSPRTAVTIVGEKFHINGEPTWKGKTWKDASIEGLLFNARMVQGIYDDLNPATRWRWSYPDGSSFSAERNTRELVHALSQYAASGLNAITVGIQGGSPCGSSWPCDAAGLNERDTSGFESDGSLRVPFFDRLALIIEEADRLGMVIIVQYFYLDQLWRIFSSNRDIERAADAATDWILDRGYTNVILDVANGTATARALATSSALSRHLHLSKPMESPIRLPCRQRTTFAGEPPGTRAARAAWRCAASSTSSRTSTGRRTATIRSCSSGSARVRALAARSCRSQPRTWAACCRIVATSTT